jgi:hypothetical protein
VPQAAQLPVVHREGWGVPLRAVSTLRHTLGGPQKPLAA